MVQRVSSSILNIITQLHILGGFGWAGRRGRGRARWRTGHDHDGGSQEVVGSWRSQAI